VRRPSVDYHSLTHALRSVIQFIQLRPHGGVGDSIVFRRRTIRWGTLQRRQSASRLHGNATGVWGDPSLLDLHVFLLCQVMTRVAALLFQGHGRCGR
jgi:hypothetical protein